MSDLILSSLKILLKLLTIPLAIVEFSQKNGIDLLLNIFKDCGNEIKILILNLFKNISKVGYICNFIYQQDFDAIVTEFERIITTVVDNIFCGLAEIQEAALNCLLSIIAQSINNIHFFNQ